MNRINLTGYISAVRSDENCNQVWLTICNNEKYIDKDGKEKTTPSFFNVRIRKEKFDESKYKVGILANVQGIPKSFVDKNNISRFYVSAFSIDELYPQKNETISYDKDGVMLWKGQRCESKEATEEEIKEMEDLLSEFK